MPHLLVTKHNNITTPSTCDDVVFSFLASSQKENKILVKCDNQQFFLTTKEKDGNILVKVDNSTRVSPVSIVKKAINAYGKLSKADILFSNTDNISRKVEPKKEFLKDISYFINDFKTTKEIFIEVGFGSGRHLIHQALQNPDKIIIGLEIHTPSIEQMLKQVNIQGVINILAVNYDARLFLEFMKSNSISRVFVHFPVPWDKKPHRRVMSPEFIKESLRALKPNGTLELRTDSPNYFEYAKELLENFKEFPSQIIKNQDLEVTSKYETRWKKQGKDIWDVTITSTINDDELVIEDDFTFDKKVDTLALNLDKKPIVKDDFLVHFENILTINECDILIQLTMGSFNKPVSKFIIVENGKASYFQGNPIPTSANLKAHSLIKNLIGEK
ncbi:MAG: tRNA (guanosine(46)-N7)-methyltransferase TrmB [Arcobacteraceae bacterium]|nr:tRNA (guanosine(46)-N7)-methyltransferase TrmB [Arcobacteraceae bacterium]